MFAARSTPFVLAFALAGATLLSTACTSGTTPVCDDAGSCLIEPGVSGDGAAAAEAAPASDGAAGADSAGGGGGDAGGGDSASE